MARNLNAAKRLPWVDYPIPMYSNLPGFAIRLTYFCTDAGDAQWPPPDYPYRLDGTDPRRVHYYSMSGCGDPPNDIGYPGDVYLDVTPGQRRRLFYRNSKYWVQNPEVPATTSMPARHPYASAILIGGGAKSSIGLAWYSPDVIAGMRKATELRRRVAANTRARQEMREMTNQAAKRPADNVDPRNPEELKRAKLDDTRAGAITAIGHVAFDVKVNTASVSAPAKPSGAPARMGPLARSLNNIPSITAASAAVATAAVTNSTATSTAIAAPTAAPQDPPATASSGAGTSQSTSTPTTTGTLVGGRNDGAFPSTAYAFMFKARPLARLVAPAAAAAAKSSIVPAVAVPNGEATSITAEAVVPPALADASSQGSNGGENNAVPANSQASAQQDAAPAPSSDADSEEPASVNIEPKLEDDSDEDEKPGVDEDGVEENVRQVLAAVKRARAAQKATERERDRIANEHAVLTDTHNDTQRQLAESVAEVKDVETELGAAREEIARLTALLEAKDSARRGAESSLKDAIRILSESA
ncbi:hypothetical protein PLICRDRAFT_127342 [Plicaturopsis crispa FD-325 SS-3]|uniref:Uncharacterized protein n=1 Tax=Plicaturopsis crispa FD-325 SS-3 TaxID=944288 RepID=A0A0C9T5H9_PLICR|nr:hypothetical protein PLICRDRAFT_127342 [Plicaturopsis crispa FD-325 SS-3]